MSLDVNFMKILRRHLYDLVHKSDTVNNKNGCKTAL